MHGSMFSSVPTSTYLTMVSSSPVVAINNVSGKQILNWTSVLDYSKGIKTAFLITMQSHLPAWQILEGY